MDTHYNHPMQNISKNTSGTLALWLIILAAALVILRIPALMHPVLDVDEAIYGLFARIWFDGGIPYLNCVETKPLGIYFIYGLIFSIFGKFNMTAVHAVTIGIVGITAYVIALIARATSDERRATSDPPTEFILSERQRVEGLRAGERPATEASAGERATAFWAALFYIVFSTTYIPKYIATTIEPVMLLPVVLQYYLWLRFERENKFSLAFLSGLAFSAACLFKYQAGMNLVILVIYLLLVRRNFKGFATFLAGAIPLPLLMIAYLWQAGALDSFVFWAVRGNSAYIGGGSETINLGHQILTRVLPFIASTALLWVLVVIRAIHFAGDSARRASDEQRATGGERRATSDERRATKKGWLIILWLILSFVPVSMGRRFYGHYFLLLLPPMAILAAPIAASIFESAGHKWKKFLIVFWIVLPALGFFAARFFISDIHKAAGEDNLDDYKPIASYIKARTAPDDRILVWGYAASIYWFAERLPSSRFFWSDLVVGRIPASKAFHLDHEKFVMPEAREMFMDDLNRRKPAYIIDTSPAGLHDYENFPITYYKEFADYIDQYYREETRIDGAVFYKRKTTVQAP